MNANQKLANALFREEAAARALRLAAVRYALGEPDATGPNWDALVAAAKRHTTAAHETSRQRKRLREAEGGADA